MSAVVGPLLGRRTKNPIEVGETRVFGVRFVQGSGGFVHLGDVIKEIETLTNSIFGIDVRVVRVAEVDLLRELKVGEPAALVLRVDHLEKHRLGPILTISFLARRVRDGKDTFSGHYRIRLL